MNLWSLLDGAASVHPERTGVVDGVCKLAYGELRERAAALALFFRARGLTEGECVSILSWNNAAFFETYFAAAGAGLILNSLNARLSARETAEILRDCGTRWLVAETTFADLVSAVLAETPSVQGVVWIGAGTPACAVESVSFEMVIASQRAHSPSFVPSARGGDDVAHLYYTSGTTGRPKGVMLTHANVAKHAHGTIGELELRESDTWAHIAPMFHLADAWATFAITLVGGRHVMMSKFEPERALELIARERVTITNLIPTMLNLMVKHPSVRAHDYSALRTIMSGGAPIAPEVVRAVCATFGCDYVQSYGMTETSPFLTLSVLKEHLRALPEAEQFAYKCKTGRAFPTVELRVVGDDGRDVPADETTVGEIRVRGATVTPGYWNRPEETRAAFADGWLKTGDLAVIDREGYVTIVDRAKDMILSGGENVYSAEVEHVLYAHPAVLEAAVFGVPDETWGESVRAAVVLRPGHVCDAPELIAFCRIKLAPFKCPRVIDFLAELPRTGSGKIMKRALRDPHWIGRVRKV